MVESLRTVNRWRRYWPTPRPRLGTCCRSAHCCQSWPAAVTRSMCARFPPVSRSANGSAFTTDAIDPRIEQIELDDWKATNPLAALKLSVAAFGRRAAHEVPDLADAVARVHPDALLVDVNCWGALSAADAGGIPWACFSPYTPPLRSPGVPPFGLGLKPMSGVLGRMRDAAVRTAVVGTLERVMLPPINTIRANVGVGPVASMDEFLRRAPLILRRERQAISVPANRLGRCGADDRTLRAGSRAGHGSRLAGRDRPAHRPRHDVVGETGRRPTWSRPR